MHEGPNGPQAAADRRASVAALLDWWKTAGVDAVVSADPHPWFAPAVLAEAAVPLVPPAPSLQLPADPYAAVTSLAQLAELVRARMPNAPFADGDPASGLMILGEAPSAEDLRTGRPFSGPAGQLLDRMLAAIGIDRTQCYIALLCPGRRVPGTPTPDEIAAELPLTRAHVRLAKPRLILLLGGNPVHALTSETAPIGRLRGRWLEVDGIPALATWNPAYLLRRPEDKGAAWADLLALKRRLSQ
jgi:DNA polymerase